MTLDEKFRDKLYCTCKQLIVFDLIGDIECDWGSHTVIQCPKCQELFSIDKECPAFTSVLELLRYNTALYSDVEQAEYLENSHLS